MAVASEPGAIETARRIARGESSAVEECEAAIARIEARDGAINAVVVRDFERAREAARAADEALGAGERRPLLGVPITVKESHDVAGLPTSWGLEQHRHHVATRDSVAVARLKAAGAVILGKTNVALGLADWQADNPVYGRTVNPHDPALTCGGSSGGAAAALASGMVPLELGSDIGGSIRVPAHYCGVYGLKPTYGAVSAQGHFFPGTDGADPPLGVVGPMARSAADVALALDIVSDVALPRPRRRRIEDYRLLALTRHPLARADRAIVAAVERVADACADAGATVEHASRLLPELEPLHRSYMRMLAITLERGAAPPGREPTSLTDWFELLDDQARATRRWRRLFEEFDAVLAPVVGATAFAHETLPIRERTLTIDGAATPFGDQFAWIGMATFAGLPAIAAPAGVDPEGLPIGIQIIGDTFADQGVIDLARLIAGIV